MAETINMLDNGNSEVTGPAPDSPRTVWFRENRKKLDEKEEEEKAARAEIQAKAQAYMQKFAEDRQSRIEECKKTNRAEEQQTVEAGSGMLGDTAWERVISLINFNLGAQQKDTARLRALLFQAREANLPIKE